MVAGIQGHIVDGRDEEDWVVDTIAEGDGGDVGVTTTEDADDKVDDAVEVVVVVMVSPLDFGHGVWSASLGEEGAWLNSRTTLGHATTVKKSESPDTCIRREVHLPMILPINVRASCLSFSDRFLSNSLCSAIVKIPLFVPSAAFFSALVLLCEK